MTYKESTVLYQIMKFRCVHPDESLFPTVKYYDIVAASTDPRIGLLFPQFKVFVVEKDIVYFNATFIIADEDERWA